MEGGVKRAESICVCERERTDGALGRCRGVGVCSVDKWKRPAFCDKCVSEEGARVTGIKNKEDSSTIPSTEARITRNDY